MNKDTKRSKSGSFYTPRYIVDYVVRESLLFVLLRRVFSGDERHEQNIRNLLDPEYDYRDDLFDVSERSNLINTVENLTVMDPAVGAGAFLLSMLDSLVLVLNRLQSDGSDFDRKLHVIKNCLYGVDVQHVACEIARVGLFLSLIDDDRDVDHNRLSEWNSNIVVADSLVDLFGTSTREQVNVEFEGRYVLGERRFDIVIGNPPYRQLKKNKGELRKRYKGVGFSTFTGTGDIYQLFIEKSISMLRSDDSFLGFVTSNTWLKSKYGSLTRKLLLQHSVFRLINLGPKVFPGAIVDTCILIVMRGRGSNVDCKVADTNVLPPTEWECLHRLKNYGPWCIVSADERDLLEKMELSSHKVLGEHAGVFMSLGMITRNDRAFVVSDSVKEQIVEDDPSAADILLPVLRGKNIRSYRAEWDGSWLVNTHPGVDVDEYPSVRNYLSGLMDSEEYNHVRRHSWFHSPKLMWQEMSHCGRCFYDKEGKYSTLSSTYVMTCDNVEYLPWFCAILNSSVVSWWLNSVGMTTGLGLPRWMKCILELLPIPDVSSGVRERIVGLVECAESNTDVQREIDIEVARAYGLGSQEMAVAGL